MIRVTWKTLRLKVRANEVGKGKTKFAYERILMRSVCGCRHPLIPVVFAEDGLEGLDLRLSRRLKNANLNSWNLPKFQINLWV